MIFYFSRTGNSEWVAKKVADKIDDKAVDIISLDLAELNAEQKIVAEKYIGFVFPVYAWGVPEPMLDFVKNLKGANEQTTAFTFGICTCGEDAGAAMKKLSKIYPLCSAYSIAMPNNYVIGSELESDEVVLNKIKSAEGEIDKISAEISEGKKQYRVHEGSLAAVKSGMINKVFNRFARSTSSFWVEKDKCISCISCAKNCPSKAIELENGNPVWKKRNCYMCLRCINCCPTEAIEYGKNTASRKRYNINKFVKYIF